MLPVTKRVYYRFFKRPFDFVVALAGLLCLLLPLGVIALVVLLVDGAPVIFSQDRVGQNGRVFKILKFRTMRGSAASRSSITVAGDPQITPVGRCLRRWKLDELPQLLNVLKGDMSFVGPRPDVPGYMDKLEGQAAALLQLRPGITGPATLAFKNEEELLAAADDPRAFNDQVIFPQKVRLNLEYLREISLRSDLRYILATFTQGKTR